MINKIFTLVILTFSTAIALAYSLNNKVSPEDEAEIVFILNEVMFKGSGNRQEKFVSNLKVKVDQLHKSQLQMSFDTTSKILDMIESPSDYRASIAVIALRLAPNHLEFARKVAERFEKVNKCVQISSDFCWQTRNKSINNNFCDTLMILDYANIPVVCDKKEP
ncbi:MAG: hypothetical protein H7Y09_07525 [Chitinophagaceae bacterium]|nr:hypothetical protein [Anaerolineae bacterium]